jgi:hypothetical protein|tara:strand:+ start:183 stop:578 length:396 start_codon:yes stop_codon:yes gene_type:complete
VKKAITVVLPAPHKAQIRCPVCEGNKCRVCNFTGSLKIDVEPRIPIQRTHIIKYIAENIQTVANELTKKYGLNPEVNTVEVLELNDGQYEVVQVSSLGGVCWIVNRLDELDTPRYFTSKQELERFKQGWMN